MRISLNIPPRRAALALIILVGLGLRLWGLSWGRQAELPLHPGEWTFQIIDSLSLSQPVFPGIWTQAFFSLAAIFKWLFGNLAGLVGLTLGEVRFVADLAISGRMAGRVMVALLSAAQPALVYLMARRMLDSMGAGLLAAALVAVNPLLAAQAHYLTLDAPLATAALVCVLLAWKAAVAPTPSRLAWLGLAMGLAITTRASGVLVAAPVGLALLRVVWRARPKPLGWHYKWFGAFFGGLVAGLLLGYPGFVLQSDDLGQMLAASLPELPRPDQDFLLQGLARLKAFLAVMGQQVGWHWVIFWAGGSVFLLYRRRLAALMLASFPLLYALAGVAVLKAPPGAVAAVIAPLLFLPAAWPLVALCRQLPGAQAPRLALALVLALSCLWPAWRAVGVGYLFWQEDTLTSSSLWMSANLPPKARVLSYPAGPFALNRQVRPLPIGNRPGDLARQADFLVISSLDPGAPLLSSYARPSLADLASQAPLRFQLIKEFSIKTASNPALDWWKPAFPSWVSPTVRVYATFPPSPPRQHLAILPPAVEPTAKHAVLYPGPMPHTLERSAFLLSAGGEATRVLRLDRPPVRLAVSLVNLGEQPSRVGIQQGLLAASARVLYPGESAVIFLKPRAWPPVLSGLYPVKVSITGGGPVYGRLFHQPMFLAMLSLQKDDPVLAAEILSQGPELAWGFDAGVILAKAYLEQGKFKKAKRALEEISALAGDPAKTYVDLASQSGPGFEESLVEFTGFAPPWLFAASRASYRIESPPPTGDKPLPLSGRGFQGRLTPGSAREPAILTIWPSQIFPPGPWLAQVSLAGLDAAEGAAAVLQVWDHGPHGSQLLANSRLPLNRAGGRPPNLSAGFTVSRLGHKLEFRLQLPPGGSHRVRELTVSADFRGHMTTMLRWYFEAWGGVCLKEKRFEAAVASYQALLRLDPHYLAAYLPLAQALVDVGRLEDAYRMARRAEARYQNMPDQLAQVREVYQTLKKEADATRLNQRLAILRPSLKGEAVFDSGMRLLGYDLPKSRVPPGGELTVSYYWKVDRTPPLNYFIFVHLLGSGKLFPYDHLLDHGRAPMTRLKPGQVVREDYRMAIPKDLPRGRYRLVVGMWDPKFSGRRVRVLTPDKDRDDQVVLAEVDVD